MIKFWIVNRPKPGQSLEQFDYEWGVVHTALMLSNRTSLEAFQRYAQHRTMPTSAITDAELLFPRSEHEWCAASDHWLTSVDDFELALSPEYKRRMQPHSFGDSAFVLELTSGEVRFEHEACAAGQGGVKLLHFLHKRDDVTQAEFVERWQGEYADSLLDAAAHRRALVRRYVQNPQLPLDRDRFAGTLFELGGCQTYSGIEELWFDSVDDACTFAADESVRATVARAERAFLDVDRSFGLPVVERVAFDRSYEGAPQPAIFDDDSFEARFVATERGWGEWRTPLERVLPAHGRDSGPASGNRSLSTAGA
jgi:hypothetical protein